LTVAAAAALTAAAAAAAALAAAAIAAAAPLAVVCSYHCRYTAASRTGVIAALRYCHSVAVSTAAGKPFSSLLSPVVAAVASALAVAIVAACSVAAAAAVLTQFCHQS
jgi:hypothetical protein